MSHKWLYFVHTYARALRHYALFVFMVHYRHKKSGQISADMPFLLVLERFRCYASISLVGRFRGFWWLVLCLCAVCACGDGSVIGEGSISVGFVVGFRGVFGLCLNAVRVVLTFVTPFACRN